MSAVLRAPTINHLQRLLGTRTLFPRSSPTSRRLLLIPRQTTLSPFSTSRGGVRNKSSTNSSTSGAGDTDAHGNPAYPRFDLRSIVPNPRLRRVVVAAFVVLVAAETYMWVTYWPKVMGWWQGQGEGEGGEKGSA